MSGHCENQGEEKKGEREGLCYLPKLLFFQKAKYEVDDTRDKEKTQKDIRDDRKFIDWHSLFLLSSSILPSSIFGLEEEERMIGEKIKLIVYNIVANKRSTKLWIY